MTTTATVTVTGRQIRTLREEALAAGDYRQADLCAAALCAREDANDDGSPLVDSDGNPTTRSHARAECARVIEAAAQAALDE
jgi:hypothetical protein